MHNVYIVLRFLMIFKISAICHIVLHVIYKWFLNSCILKSTVFLGLKGLNFFTTHGMMLAKFVRYTVIRCYTVSSKSLPYPLNKISVCHLHNAPVSSENNKKKSLLLHFVCTLYLSSKKKVLKCSNTCIFNWIHCSPVQWHIAATYQ